MRSRRVFRVAMRRKAKGRVYEQTPELGPPPSIGLWGDTHGFSGLSIHARNMLLAMQDEGLPVEQVGPPQGHTRNRRLTHGLLMGLPFRWRSSGLVAPHLIGYMVFEANTLPAGYVRNSARLEEMWTASMFGTEVIRSSGITLPVHVVPGGVDLKVFHPPAAPRPDRPWTFTAIGKPEARKNYEGLVAAYRAAFTGADDVVLRILASGHAPASSYLSRILETSASPNGPAIERLGALPDAAAVADLLRATDVFVLPTRGEGWGLPILEAMACGCCVVTTNWSAPRDFVSPRAGFLVDYKLVKASCPYFNRFYRGKQWADPSHEQLVETMRWTYLNPDKARAMGQAAASDATQWTWANAARKARGALGL